jgi:16S rRNA (uracil1498-N3)-methyltransferase
MPDPDPGHARHRFFVDPAILGGDRVALTGPQAHQISRVLRLAPGDRIVLLDGRGREYLVQLDEVRSSAVGGAVEAVTPSRPEPSPILTLYQALVPRERFETVLQKGTEVGIARFVPTWCERSIVPGGERIDERRLERWRRIATEAAEQCERGVVPEITAPMRFADAMPQAVRAGPTLVAWERETERSVREGLRVALPMVEPAGTAEDVPDNDPLAASGRLPRSRHEPVRCAQGKLCSSADRPPRVARERGTENEGQLSIFVGPEGGFTDAEVALARRHGAQTVSLGPRILRTETAGPILAALALYEAGELEP